MSAVLGLLKRVIEGKHIPTGEKLTLWRCDTCGFEGTTGTWKAHDGEEGHWCYKCRERSVKSPLRDVEVDELRWERGYTEVKCCGAWLLCDRFTNTCERCHADYNGSGQLLAPREQWGEETGESVADILAVDALYTESEDA